MTTSHDGHPGGTARVGLKLVPPADGADARRTVHNCAYAALEAVAYPGEDGILEDTPDWLASLRAAEGFLRSPSFSPRTVGSYGQDLLDFFRHAREIHLPPLRFDRAGVEAYVEQLRSERRLAVSTAARRLSALSGFFSFAEAEGLVKRNPMAHVRRPRVPAESQALGLTSEEMTAVLAAAQRHSVRAHALVALLVGNGLRLGEILAADADDVGSHRGLTTLRVRRKGQHITVVPLADATAEAVHGYLNGRTSGPLMLSRSGRRLDPGSANALLRRVAATVLPAARAQALHAHLFRHGWVAATLDSGVALPDVMRAAGHRSPSTTMRYDRSREDLSRNHPVFHLAEWMQR